MTTTFDFIPASQYREQHGLFVSLVGTPNSGKTFSALRLARGIAGQKGRLAVLDSEGGRTLHLKKDFAFDVMVMGPPHRPERYLEAAEAAQAKSYDALVIDSFTTEWRGLGGVLDWADDEAAAMLTRKRARAEQMNWNWDEAFERDKVKMASLIRPKMAHKLMMSGLLGLRIPIIFSVRGEISVDPNPRPKPDADAVDGGQQRGRARASGPQEVFKPLCDKAFPFEVTVSFRLARDRKGVIDLSDPTSYKMEGSHREIFRDGDLLSEEHGAKLIAWARGAEAVQQAQRQPQREPERVQQQQQPQPGQPARRTLGDYLSECLAGCRTPEEVTRLSEEDPVISKAMDRPQVRQRVEARYFDLMPPPPPEEQPDDIDASPIAA